MARTLPFVLEQLNDVKVFGSRALEDLEDLEKELCPLFYHQNPNTFRCKSNQNLQNEVQHEKDPTVKLSPSQCTYGLSWYDPTIVSIKPLAQASRDAAWGHCDDNYLHNTPCSLSTSCGTNTDITKGPSLIISSSPTVVSNVSADDNPSSLARVVNIEEAVSSIDLTYDDEDEDEDDEPIDLTEEGPIVDLTSFGEPTDDLQAQHQIGSENTLPEVSNDSAIQTASRSSDLTNTSYTGCQSNTFTKPMQQVSSIISDIESKVKDIAIAYQSIQSQSLISAAGPLSHSTHAPPAYRNVAWPTVQQLVLSAVAGACTNALESRYMLSLGPENHPSSVYPHGAPNQNLAASVCQLMATTNIQTSQCSSVANNLAPNTVTAQNSEMKPPALGNEPLVNRTSNASNYQDSNQQPPVVYPHMYSTNNPLHQTFSSSTCQDSNQQPQVVFSHLYSMNNCLHQPVVDYLLAVPSSSNSSPSVISRCESSPSSGSPGRTLDNETKGPSATVHGELPTYHPTEPWHQDEAATNKPAAMHNTQDAASSHTEPPKNYSNHLQPTSISEFLISGEKVLKLPESLQASIKDFIKERQQRKASQVTLCTSKVLVSPTAGKVLKLPESLQASIRDFVKEQQQENDSQKALKSSSTLSGTCPIQTKRLTKTKRYNKKWNEVTPHGISSKMKPCKAGQNSHARAESSSNKTFTNTNSTNNSSDVTSSSPSFTQSTAHSEPSNDECQAGGKLKNCTTSSVERELESLPEKRSTSTTQSPQIFNSRVKTLANIPYHSPSTIVSLVYRCGHCRRSCSTEASLAEHKARMHPPTIYYCDMCDEILASEYELRVHKKAHHRVLQQTKYKRSQEKTRHANQGTAVDKILKKLNKRLVDTNQSLINVVENAEAVKSGRIVTDKDRAQCPKPTASSDSQENQQGLDTKCHKRRSACSDDESCTDNKIFKESKKRKRKEVEQTAKPLPMDGPEESSASQLSDCRFAEICDVGDKKENRCVKKRRHRSTDEEWHCHCEDEGQIGVKLILWKKLPKKTLALASWL